MIDVVPLHPKVQAVLACVKDGVIDGNVDLYNCGLTALPDLSGVRVTGNFDCACNYLASLQGAPASVGGYFDCFDNRLTSLRGAPASVGGSFDCSRNRLTSLQGAPKTTGYFDCADNTRTFTQREVAQAKAGRLPWATLGGLAEAADSVHYAAADYVEQVLGYQTWQHNWPRVKDPLGSVTAWLQKTRRDCDPAAVVKELGRLAGGTAWTRGAPAMLEWERAKSTRGGQGNSVKRLLAD